jgi:hypothetical protein
LQEPKQSSLSLQEIIEKRIEEEKEFPRPKEKRTLALLINGDNTDEDKVHQNNIARAYNTLRQQGVYDSDIFILSPTNPRDTNKQVIDGFLINHKATLENVKAVFSYIATISDTDHTIIVYTTGHGYDNENQTKERYLRLENEELLSSKEYARLIESLNDSYLVVSVSEQCFSGSFTDALKKSKTPLIAMSNTDRNHVNPCYYFAVMFWNAFCYPEVCDQNKDSKVSVREAYNFADAANTIFVNDSKTYGEIEEDAFPKSSYVTTSPVIDCFIVNK